jgi:hypothetical protein
MGIIAPELTITPAWRFANDYCLIPGPEAKEPNRMCARALAFLRPDLAKLDCRATDPTVATDGRHLRTPQVCGYPTTEGWKNSSQLRAIFR